MSKFSYTWYGIHRLSIIPGPTEFFTRVMTLLKKSHRVFIVTLYIGGNDDKSHELFELLQERKRNKLYTRIILDKNRGTEERTMSFIKKYDLEEMFTFRDVIPLPLPGIIKQILKVLHEKVYIFDNVVIVSGANLGGRYFSTIHDRYYELISPELASILVFRYFNEFMPYDSIVSDTKVAIIDDEDHLIKTIYEHFKDPILASPYPNMPIKYQKLLASHKFIVPAPECNTFDDRPIIKSITSLILTRLDKSIKLLFYNNKDLLCHLKGIWAFEDFAITCIGSSNYNARSANRDSELNFLIITKDPKVMNDIKKELDSIVSQTTEISDLTVQNSFLSKLLYFFFGTFF